MVGALIYEKKDYDLNKEFANLLIKYANENNILLELIIVEDYIFSTQNIVKYDFCIMRSRNYIYSEFFENFGVRCFNNSVVNRIANNKFLSLLFVKKLGIPITESVYSNNVLLNYDVIKSLDGHGGKEVYKNQKPLVDKEYIYQEYYENLGDIRVYCIGKKIIKAIKRKNNNDFRHNYKLGASIESYELDEKLFNYVTTILEKIDSDYVGIDFLLENDDYRFIELESVVGARMLYSLTNIDIAYEFINYIKLTIENEKEKKDGIIRERTKFSK